MSKRPLSKKQQQTENKKRIAALGRYWELGRTVHLRIKGTKRSDRVPIYEALEKEFNKSRASLDQSHIFFRLYPTKKEFQELCRQCQAGHALTTQHVHVLNAVHDDRKRKQLQKASIRKGWSSNELRHEVKKRFRPKRYESVERRKPHSLEDALLQLADIAHLWLLWSKRLESAELLEELKAELPRNISKGIASVLQHCEAVCNFDEERIQSRESKRPPIPKPLKRPASAAWQ